MYLGRNLQYLRKCSGSMTQEKLAERMLVSRQTVSKWESGESVPELSKLVELCALFSCSLDALVTEDMSARLLAEPSVRVRKVRGFRYASYTVISRDPMEDARTYLQKWAARWNLTDTSPVPIGWKFPYLSQEQKQRFGLRGYVCALVLPEHFQVPFSDAELGHQDTADYAVMTVTELQGPLEASVSRAYGQILEYMKENGIRKTHRTGFLPCFERYYRQDGILCVDVYIHCQCSAESEPIILSEIH